VTSGKKIVEYLEILIEVLVAYYVLELVQTIMSAIYTVFDNAIRQYSINNTLGEAPMVGDGAVALIRIILLVVILGVICKIIKDLITEKDQMTWI
jgi:hypothetical protein